MRMQVQAFLASSFPALQPLPLSLWRFSGQAGSDRKEAMGGGEGENLS